MEEQPLVIKSYFWIFQTVERRPNVGFSFYLLFKNIFYSRGSYCFCLFVCGMKNMHPIPDARFMFLFSLENTVKKESQRTITVGRKALTLPFVWKVKLFYAGHVVHGGLHLDLHTNGFCWPCRSLLESASNTITSHVRSTSEWNNDVL